MKVKYQMNVMEWVEDKDGGHFEEHMEEREYDNSDNRHCDLCIVCGFPEYPECTKWCQSEKWRLERLEKERLKNAEKAE